jgi:hypothetical protein
LLGLFKCAVKNKARLKIINYFFDRLNYSSESKKVSYIIVDTYLNRVNFEKKLIAFNLNENLNAKFKVLQTSKDRSWLGCVIAAIKAILEGPSKNEKDKEYSEIDNKVRHC